MISGISISADAVASSRFFKDFFSADPGAYGRTGSFTGAARGKIAFDIRSPLGASPGPASGHILSFQGGPGEEQEAGDQEGATDRGDGPEPPRAAQRKGEHGAAEEEAAGEQAPPGPVQAVHAPHRPLPPEEA